MKKLLAAVLALVMALALCTSAWADEPTTITVKSVSDLQDAITQVKNATGEKEVIIDIQDDLTFSTWTAPEVRDAKLANVTATIKGNGHTFTGMTQPLFAGVEMYKMSISDLTISDSTIGGVTVGSVEVGAAFVAYMGNTILSFENCHVKNCQISSEKYAGGFVGYACRAGIPDSTVTIERCTVTGNSTITGVGSTGGLMGHAMAGDKMTVTVTDTTVKDTTITCTEVENGSPQTDKVGALFGTVTNYLDSTASVSATVSGNTVTAGDAVNNAPVTTIYGRRAGSFEGISLNLTSGSYDNLPLKTEDRWAVVPDNVSVATVSDSNGDPVAYVYGDGYIQAAAKSATSGQIITITKTGTGSTLALTDVPSGVTVVSKDGAVVTVNGVEVKDGSHTVPTKLNGGYTYYVNPTETTDTGKSSPKTFDAGVAMYGVMAVMSVTGMAYVGKKKF